jgi:hypothetical protein
LKRHLGDALGKSNQSCWILANIKMKDFQKAKTSKVINAIIVDQQRRDAFDSIPILSRVLCTSHSNGSNLEQDVYQYSPPDGIPTSIELRFSKSKKPLTTSLRIYNIEDRKFKANSSDDGIAYRKKRLKFQVVKNKKPNEKIPPEFLDGLLVFAPNRRDSLLKCYNAKNEFSFDKKSKRRGAMVDNLSNPLGLS